MLVAALTAGCALNQAISRCSERSALRTPRRDDSPLTPGTSAETVAVIVLRAVRVSRPEDHRKRRRRVLRQSRQDDPGRDVRKPVLLNDVRRQRSSGRHITAETIVVLRRRAVAVIPGRRGGCEARRHHLSLDVLQPRQSRSPAGRIVHDDPGKGRGKCV